MNRTLASPARLGTASFLRDTVVLIPALNEAPCISATVAAWLELGVGRVRVVDNGSTDQTAALARASGAEVLEEHRRGYGAAAWRGLGDWPSALPWVLFSSADGSDRLTAAETHAWQAALDHSSDLVVGDRLAFPEGRAQLKPTQRFGNWITCQALRVGWGRRFRDMGSMRLTRRNGLMQLGLADRGFGWNVEMQVKAIEQGWQIAEIPVRYYPRVAGQSKISGSVAGTFRAGAGIIRMLVWLWRLHREKRPITAAAPRLSVQDCDG